MTSWRDQSFWSKVQTCTLLALIGMFTSYTDAHWIKKEPHPMVSGSSAEASLCSAQ